MPTFQYNDDAVPPGIIGDDTRWVSAPNKHLANAVAAAMGWRECGGEIFAEDCTFHEGADIIVTVNPEGKSLNIRSARGGTAPQRRSKSS